MKSKKQIIDEVVQDYEQRKEMRKDLERRWKTNIDFYNGEQNGGVDKQYFWQSAEVFNHIGPLVESRLAILAEVKPKIDDELLQSVFNKIRFHYHLTIHSRPGDDARAGGRVWCGAGMLTGGETRWQLLLGATNHSATITHRPKPSNISSSVW